VSEGLTRILIFVKKLHGKLLAADATRTSPQLRRTQRDERVAIEALRIVSVTLAEPRNCALANMLFPPLLGTFAGAHDLYVCSVALP
jgi:hypothetical protein